MINGESIIHYYCMYVVKLGVVVIMSGIIIALIWARWIKNR